MLLGGPFRAGAVGEDAVAGAAPGEDADELDGVDLDPLAVRALAELAARGPVEHELERLAVDARPLGDDVGDETTVVVGGEVHRVAGRGAQVDAVGPHVAREPDVEQVPEPHPADGRPERDRQVAHRAAASASDRRRPSGRWPQLGHDLVVREVGALADLELVHAVDPVVRIDLRFSGTPRTS